MASGYCACRADAAARLLAAVAAAAQEEYEDEEEMMEEETDPDFTPGGARCSSHSSSSCSRLQLMPAGSIRGSCMCSWKQCAPDAALHH